jgi:hypothetical protein
MAASTIPEITAVNPAIAASTATPTISPIFHISYSIKDLATPANSSQEVHL